MYHHLVYRGFDLHRRRSLVSCEEGIAESTILWQECFSSGLNLDRRTLVVNCSDLGLECLTIEHE